MIRVVSLKTFCGDRAGIAAVEFAMILPLMLLIYLGGFDVMRLVRVADKVENASKTLADLTAQEPTTAPVPISDIVTAIQGSAIAASPFNTATLSLTVTAVDLTLTNNVCCTATVRWSLSQGGTPRPCNTNLLPIGPNDPWATNTIPAQIANQSVVVVGSAQTNVYESSVIVTDVSYVYTGLTPAISNLISQHIMRHSYSIPRSAGQITIPSGTSAPTGMTLNEC